MHTSLSERLATLGLERPPASPPGSPDYVSWTLCGNLLFISGQIPKWGDARFIGRVGAELIQEQGQQAAELAALNLLCLIDEAVDGRLERVACIAKLGVFVAASPEFTGHTQVGNGASALLLKVLGDAGRHARTSVGVASLPRGVAVEVDAIVELVS